MRFTFPRHVTSYLLPAPYPNINATGSLIKYPSYELNLNGPKILYMSL